MSLKSFFPKKTLTLIGLFVASGIALAMQCPNSQGNDIQFQQFDVNTYCLVSNAGGIEWRGSCINSPTKPSIKPGQMMFATLYGQENQYKHRIAGDLLVCAYYHPGTPLYPFQLRTPVSQGAYQVVIGDNSNWRKTSANQKNIAAICDGSDPADCPFKSNGN